MSLPFYRNTRHVTWPFAAKPARALFAPPPDPWPGDSGRGEDYMRGEFRFAGLIAQAVPEALKPPYIITLPASPWSPAHAGPRWLAAMHGFAWLDDLRAVGSDTAKRAARGFLVGWIRARGRYPAVAWRADVSGRRLSSWLTHFEFLCSGIDEAFRYWLSYELMGEARHLARAYMFAPAGAGRFVAAKGLIYAACCLPGRRHTLDRWLRALDAEIDRQILLDGGHVDRNPSLLFAIFRDLVDIKMLLARAGRDAPAKLNDAAERMAAMLRHLRHGDGGFALFNGGCEEAGWIIDMALARADVATRLTFQSGDSGFQRLGAGRTTVLVDVGPPPAGPGAMAHAGCLSFEASIGRHRLITNVGAAITDNRDWLRAERATAAHSTLTVDDVNSSELFDTGGIGRHPRQVACQRHESEDGIWIDASHDGYGPLFGLRHRRRLFLSADGNDLRGEDALEPLKPPAKRARQFVVRFHLHPMVKASLAEDPNQVLLRLPSGEGWRLRVRGGRVSLAESVYLGQAGSRLPSEQIVIVNELPAGRDAPSATDAPGATQVQWALKKIEGS
ncbi:MAG: heparinase II/III family protein [Alphaproteobacteria bacterium]